MITIVLLVLAWSSFLSGFGYLVVCGIARHLHESICIGMPPYGLCVCRATARRLALPVQGPAALPVARVVEGE